MRSVPKLLAPMGFGLLLLVLLARSIESAEWLIYVARYPFGVDYGEGIVLQQALLVPGPDAYGDITRYPFIVFHYPPIYLLLVRSFIALGFDPLLAGRAISLTATGSIVVLVSFGAWALSSGLGGRPRAFGAITAGLVVLASPIVTAWGALARVDMLAVALSLSAMILAAHSAGSAARLYLSVVLSVLAVYTKQTSIAAPVAIVVGLLICRPRDAVRAIVSGLGLGAAFFVALMVTTDGRFFRHIAVYNVNRFSTELLLARLGTFILYLGGVPGLLALRAMMLLAPERLGRQWWFSSSRRREVGATPALLLLVMAIAALAASTPMLLLVGKSGAMLNYAIEWLCYAALLVGCLMAHLSAPALTPARAGQEQAGLSSLSAPMLLAAFVFMSLGETREDITAHRDERVLLLQEVRATPRPVLSDDMVLLLQAGKRVPWEAAIFAELSATGQWDENVIIDLIRSRFFAFIITEGALDSPMFLARYTPAVIAAMNETYPRRESLTYAVVHRPPD